MCDLSLLGYLCLSQRSEKEREDSRAFNNLTNCLDELLAAGLMDKAMRPFGEFLSWSVVHGATSLIVGGHLEIENYESILDGLEMALGIRKQ